MKELIRVLQLWRTRYSNETAMGMAVLGMLCLWLATVIK